MPYQPPTQPEDAVIFFDRMLVIDRRVAELMKDEHAKTAEKVTMQNKELPELEISANAWYPRP